MRTPEFYATYKAIKNKLHGLNFNGTLSTWNIATGKLLEEHAINEHNYEKYEIMNKYKQNTMILRTKQ